MTELMVVTFLGLVAIAPMGYLAIMATAVKRSDTKPMAVSSAR